jgi:hypothetical protein
MMKIEAHPIGLRPAIAWRCGIGKRSEGRYLIVVAGRIPE